MIFFCNGVAVVSTAKCLYLVASFDLIVARPGLGEYESQATFVGSVVIHPKNFNLEKYFYVFTKVFSAEKY